MAASAPCWAGMHACWTSIDWTIPGVVLAVLAIVVSRVGVRGVGLALLRTYQTIGHALLRARGLTPDTAAERRVVSGAAWAEFCDTLKAAGATCLAPGLGTPADPFNQAEGYRYLARIARAGLENFLEGASAEAPTLTCIVDGNRAAPIKLGSDNPDNLYFNATIAGRYAYRVHGTRGTVNYLGFGTQAGQYGQPGGLQTVAYLEGADMTVNSDGTFDIVLSPERPADLPARANWLRTATEPDLGLLIVRQTFLDRARETPAAVHIERWPEAGNTVPRPLTCAQLEHALQSTGLLVAGASLMFAQWANAFQRHTNALPMFSPAVCRAKGGDPNIVYYHSYWRVAPGECLVVAVRRPPECPHWNFQVNNHWMESLDYRYHPVHVNKASALYGSGGSIVIVLAHARPACANAPSTAPGYVKRGGEGDEGEELLAPTWVSTVGHECGTMCFRWVRPKGFATDGSAPRPPNPAAHVVRVADLKAFLGDGANELFAEPGHTICSP